ncbi:hypothetical protein PVAP13_9NG568800 [Panicum virgatum]|uniref:Uncharacterized protein n=1 Tax=Panicum virgatum TaxID=38727 RepID=A0A8T0N256_PANVG|nr:hypothetical protein PVAP13_9NG568800 [Panicum virgatum]
MAGEDAAAAGTAAVKKLPKEEEEEDDDELDNVPLAVSRAKKARNASASKVKKDDDDDDEEDNRPISHSRAKKKKNASAGASNAKATKVKKLKDEDLEDLKENKKRKKRVGVKEGANMSIVKGAKVKKERKVYELPGQKHDPPTERDPLRIFYESLYEQIPTSDMAATWLMEWGLLPVDVARKVFEKKQGQKLKSPVKTTTVSKRKPTSPTKTPASSAMKSVSAKNSAGKPTSQKKRKASSESDDDDDDFIMAPKAKTKRQKASS